MRAHSTTKGLRTVALLAVVCACACGPSAATTVQPPAQRNDGWSVASALDAGFDAAALEALTEDLRSGVFPNTHAVLIESAGSLVYEQYLAGEDERWGEPLGPVVFDHETKHDLRSVTKSVVSALLGIALAEEPAALDQPLVAYFPDKRTLIQPGADAITLRHALTMTAGLEWNEMTVPYTDPSNDEIRMSSSEDPVDHLLSRPLRSPPGEAWYYNGGLSQTLGSVVQRLSGKDLAAYAREVLFGPLGIVDFEWVGEPGWRPPGTPSAASGLRLRARDLAKFGSLFLHEGRWSDRQIVPADWVRVSTERHVDDIGDWSNDGVYGYGFQWWHGRFASAGGRIQAPVAVGNGGQRIFVLHDRNLVVTVLAGNYNAAGWLMSERILARIVAAQTPRR